MLSGCPTVGRSPILASVTAGVALMSACAGLSGAFTATASDFVSSTATGCGTTLSAASSGCEKFAGVTSPGVTMTRAPILVQPYSLTAKAIGMRMQPCEAGYPGSTPACIATPDHVIRCMNGIGALL